VKTLCSTLHFSFPERAKFTPRSKLHPLRQTLPLGTNYVDVNLPQLSATDIYSLCNRNLCSLHTDWTETKRLFETARERHASAIDSVNRKLYLTGGSSLSPARPLDSVQVTGIFNPEVEYSRVKQGCQMAYSQTKNPNLGNFWRYLLWKMLVHFMAF
jgi:hypothetical protein